MLTNGAAPSVALVRSSARIPTFKIALPSVLNVTKDY